MSAFRLPARPSLEQLRKQTKEKLDQLRVSDPAATLADAQFALAGDYGFDSWPKLVHHVEAVLSSGRLAKFEQFAHDLLDGYFGDVPALERIGADFGDSAGVERRRERVRDRIDALQRQTPEPTLDDTRLFIARHFGFDSWSAFAESTAQPPEAGRSEDTRQASSHLTPPFHRIDSERNIVEFEGPLSDGDWQAAIALMKERRITNAGVSALAALPNLRRFTIGGCPNVTRSGTAAFPPSVRVVQ